MIKDGYGSVFCRVFNESGKQVFDQVTALYYNHTEKADDSSRIIIETPDVSIVDNPDLQEGKVLKIVFGYLNSPPRAHKVWIWDPIPTFSADGVRLELQCYCKAAYLKLNSSNDVYENQGLDDMVDSISEQYKIDAQIENLTKKTIESITTGGKTTSKLDVSGPNAFSTIARDNTAFNLDYSFKKYIAYPQANKSDAKLLDEVVKTEPIDNIILDGRDDKLIIKRRNLYQKPYKSYRYKGEPGHLLEFTPATQHTKKRKTSVANTVSSWDEDTKTFKQSTISSKESGAPVMGDEIEWSLESQFIDSLKKGSKNKLDRPIIGATKVQFYDYTAKDEHGNPIVRKLLEETMEATKKNYTILARQGFLASEGKLPAGAGRAFVYIQKGGTNTQIMTIDDLKPFNNAAIDAVGRIETKEIIILSPKEVMHLIEDEHKDAAGAGTNRLANELAEATECQAQMLGDPELESGKIIEILGVGRKYQGNYYIVAASHEMTGTGDYIVNCTVFKTGKNKILGTDPNYVDANTLGITKSKEVELPTDGTSQLAQVPLKKD